jgi:hypothetical protein
MTQRARFAAIIPMYLLSVAMLISAVHYNVAQAKNRTAGASACRKNLKSSAAGWK